MAGAQGCQLARFGRLIGVRAAKAIERLALMGKGMNKHNGNFATRSGASVSAGFRLS